jgi:hypothetical protein
MFMWEHYTETWREVYKEGDIITVDNVLVAADATLYDDYLVSGDQVLRGSSAPDIALFRDGIYLPAFDGAATLEQGFFTVHVKHDVRNATNPTFHVHWSHNQATPSGNVKWFIEYTYAHGYRLQNFPASTTLSSVSAALTQYEHVITSDDDMEITTEMMVDGQLVCRIYRDPADPQDTFAADAFLIGVDMHYQVGQWATPERNQPFSYGSAV